MLTLDMQNFFVFDYFLKEGHKLKSLRRRRTLCKKKKEIKKKFHIFLRIITTIVIISVTELLKESLLSFNVCTLWKYPRCLGHGYFLDNTVSDLLFSLRTVSD